MIQIEKGDTVVRLTAKAVSRTPPKGIVTLVNQDTKSALVFWRNAAYEVPLKDLEKVNR